MISSSTSAATVFHQPHHPHHTMAPQQNYRIYYKFESERAYNAVKFSSAVISLQDIRHFLERKRKISFQTEKIIFWNAHKNQEVVDLQGEYFDPDTYLILKRLPTQVPPELVHVCGDEDSKNNKKLDQNSQDPSRAVMEKLITFSNQQKVNGAINVAETADALMNTMHLP